MSIFGRRDFWKQLYFGLHKDKLYDELSIELFVTAYVPIDLGATTSWLPVKRSSQLSYIPNEGQI